jgi:hypothetical protein
MSLGEDRVVHHSKIRCQLTALGQKANSVEVSGMSASTLGLD